MHRKHHIEPGDHLLTAHERLIWSDKCGWVPERATPEEIDAIAERMTALYGPFRPRRKTTETEPALPVAAE